LANGWYAHYLVILDEEVATAAFEEWQNAQFNLGNDEQ